MSEAENTVLRLNLGAGDRPMTDWINLDIKGGVSIDNLPYEDSSVDVIRASHVLEHVSHRKTHEVLAHWRTKLKPGGMVKIAVPDMQWIFNEMGKESPHDLEGFLFGGHTDADDVHRAGFTEGKLSAQLREAGFDCIERWDADHNDCCEHPCTLNLQAQKPTIGPMTDVVALMSIPRLAFTENMFSAMSVVTDLKCPIIKCTGAFWGQCLERIMEEGIKNNPDAKYFLTIDYDSVFTTDMVRRLRRIAETINADAIFPVQCKREAAHAMATFGDGKGANRALVTGEESRADALQARTGHFGLTLISVEKIKKLPKPWFLEQPDKDGAWGDGRIDPDIYFWQQWEKVGNTLYQANRVKIGHAQQVVTWPDQSWRPRHQYLKDWADNGIPLYAI